LSDCIDLVYRYTDEQLFDLIILDLGYPKAELLKAQKSISGKANASISPIWDPIPNEVSTLLYDRLEGNKAVPLSHDIKL
jgi:hypothetical protein